jgi:GH15 family glucan-1,4-alpha-glucosidase
LVLGTPDNGRWQIAPADPSPRITRQYRDSTVILETTFETEQGMATVTDFMPLSDGTSDLVRLVVGQQGRLDFRSDLVIRFDCGISVLWVSQLEDENGLQAVAGPDILVLRTPVPLHGEDLRTIGEFSVAAGETVPFVLSHGASYRPLPNTMDPQLALARTETFWRDWSARCPPVGPWSEAVKRSLLTLKALTYGPTGGIVAAATTSLPEQIVAGRATGITATVGCATPPSLCLR